MVAQCHNNVRTVRDHLPLQQGLRRSGASRPMQVSRVRDHLPLQQGLRLGNRFMREQFYCVRDHLPLQQGLRLIAYLLELR